MLSCNSDVFFGEATQLERKGITLDDRTLQYCANSIPELWPNSEAPIASMRMFRAWQMGWSDLERELAWSSMLTWIRRNGIKVMLGTPITCSDADDEAAWHWTVAFLKKLDPHQVMGFAVGNELEILDGKVPQECVARIWDQGRLWRKFQEYITVIDKMGFSEVPVTSVFTAGILYGHFPFTNEPGVALVEDFLRNATGKYGERYAFTLNIYPYLDPNLKLDAGTPDQCFNALKSALCWEEGCMAIEIMKRARERIQALTGRRDSKFWVGEIGWSSPMASSLSGEMRNCFAFSSEESLGEFYSKYLAWDLSIGSQYQPPDHVFYFTLRDALNFGEQEHFGLITTCETTACKITSGRQHVVGQVLHAVDGHWVKHALGSVALFVCFITACVGCFVRRRKADPYQYE